MLSLELNWEFLLRVFAGCTFGVSYPGRANLIRYTGTWYGVSVRYRYVGYKHLVCVRYVLLKNPKLRVNSSWQFRCFISRTMAKYYKGIFLIERLWRVEEILETAPAFLTILGLDLLTGS